MDTIKDTTELLNPGLSPVVHVAADQPLYALAKQIQWHWPDSHEEDKFVIMFVAITLKWQRSGHLVCFCR